MKNKPAILIFFALLLYFSVQSQNTFSPYSRYGIGELVPPTFAHNTGMGGAYVALKSDSTMPNFVNVGNPASYPLVRLTTLELGINFVNSNFTSNTSSLNKWTANFSYMALAFPIKANGGACFGIMPYSYVGSNTANTITEPGIGNIDYEYAGSGGLNKVFLGYGVMPFQKRLIKFRSKNLYIHDTLKQLSNKAYKRREVASKFLSDFSIGTNINFMKGNIVNTAKVIYPNSTQYYNTYRERTVSLSDFTANFGLQTAVAIDSVRTKGNKKRVLKEKVKLTFGYTFNLNNQMNGTYDATAYNYRISNGVDVPLDTIYNIVDQATNITLPFEQGFGVGIKKGEKINAVFDYSITKWQDFRFSDNLGTLKENHRFAIGVNFVPDKYAMGKGAIFSRMNYRLGANYQTGYISVNGTMISAYSVTAGFGIPVGMIRASSMLHFSAQYGIMGTKENNLIQDNFWRLSIGFTFSDKWFQKYRYD